METLGVRSTAEVLQIAVSPQMSVRWIEGGPGARRVGGGLGLRGGR